jgi:hypothetical protein
MSNFVFRLFEDLSLDSSKSERFKLEIMVNRGAVFQKFDPEDIREELGTYKCHTMPIKHEEFVTINKKLTLKDIEEFFTQLGNLDQGDDS